MRYLALAADYDGTLAHHGLVDDPTLEALRRLRGSGRKLILVTGRELDDLQATFGHSELFDRIVAENGALLYRPAEKEEKVLGEAPPPRFVAALKNRGVVPLSTGRVIVATREPHESTVLQVIHDQGLELQVIFNKGAVMVLPPGVNKATGLAAALAELGLSRHNVVGVGDAENDHAFLSQCECAAAVANALPAVKERADLVLKADHGAGVVELIDRLLTNDLKGLPERPGRHSVLLGAGSASTTEQLGIQGVNVLVAGTSGSGKSTLTTGLLERLAGAEYQFAIIDPEGDYATFPGAVVLGDPQRAPLIHEILDLLRAPDRNVAVNLLGLALEHRPAFFDELLPRLMELRVKTGRPHWLVLDEAHHLMPSDWGSGSADSPPGFHGMLLITVHPEKISPAVIRSVDVLLAVGDKPEKTLAAFCEAAGEQAPPIQPVTLRTGETLLWRRPAGQPTVVRTLPPRMERRRHSRKYAEGSLGPERSFRFRGPEGKLNLKASNLVLFLQLAEGVDEETWDFHLHRGDYSTWFRTGIKDEELAEEAAAIEKRGGRPEETRAAIRAAIESRYTLPADAPSGISKAEE